ncbi:MAG TPA: Ig-like domain-containing protein, partial [Thermoanaerobaculia bacterium]
METGQGSRFRRVARGLIVLVALAAAASVPAQTTYHQTSFHEVQVFSGLVNPTAVRFLPDGSIIVAEKSGLIKKFDSLTSTTPTIVADLRVKTYNFWDRGFLGLAIDPNFTTNHYIYVLYAYNAIPGGTAPRWVANGGDPTSDPCPTPPGATTDGCVVQGHLSRLTAVGSDWTASEQNFIEDWCQQYPSHSVGSMAFGADGMLYLSGGEGASFDNADWGQFGGTQGTPPVTPANPCGDPPFPSTNPETKPTAEGGALRSQSPRRTAGEPRVLGGSVLRLDPATGLAAPGNPMIGSSDLNERRIIAYGLRNPFRLTIKPGTNDVWLGDVGWNTWEEINRIPDHSVARNFGWPCFEGNSPQYTGLNICPTQAQTIAPYFTYNHGSSVAAGDGCPTGSSSISGMAFYGGASGYPASYTNALFFADYSRRCMWVMLPGAGGDPNPQNVIGFASGAQGPVDLQIGPDGNVYYADFDGGKIWRVEYGPIAVASASPLGGPLPLTVTFSSAGSAPAQSGDTITYAWDLDGDGQYDDSTDPNPTWTYTVGGNVTVRLKVTDNHGASSLSNPILISPNNSAPSPSIATPAPTLTWKVGDTINFSGSAVDPEQGSLPPSALSWSVIIHHCPSNCHTHLYQTFTGVASGSFPAPDHEYPSYLEIQLTATDGSGLQGTTSVNIQPQVVNFNMQSVPSGLQLSAGTTTGTTPFVKQVIVAGQIGLIAPSPQGVNTFTSWSDGGAASHTVTVGTTDTTYTANYATGSSLPPPWVDQDIGGPGQPGSALYNDGIFSVTGGGADIQGNSDQFHFAYQPISGDVTITARVAGIQPTDVWAKGGVMIREGVAANARNAAMLLTSGHGLTFQRRTVTGGATDTSDGRWVGTPYWVRVTRTGNTFFGYSSPDGTTWTLVGSVTIALPANVYVGMAVTSHNNAVGGSDVFDNVSVAGVSNSPPTVSITSPANGTVFTPPASITINATASDTDGTVTKVDFYNGATLLGTDNTSPYSFNWTNVTTGTYSLTAVATDNGGVTGTSTPVSVTVNAKPTVSITSPANNAQFTSPANITINATAADSDGTVTKVDFYQNG